MERLTECGAIENLKNLFSNYELTLPNIDSLETLQFTIKALEEVREYRSLEEQGLLIRLPCRIGDTIYKSLDVISEYTVTAFGIYKDKMVICTENNKTGNGYSFYSNRIGKRFFLTMEEAEAALERMK